MGLGQGTPGQPKYQVWGWLELVGRRPTTMVGRPAHCSTDLPPLTWQLRIGPRSQFWEDHLLKPTLLAVAPSYIYEGRGSK